MRAWANDYTDTMLIRHAAQSRRQLTRIVQDDGMDGVEVRMDVWENGKGDTRPRADVIADREAVQFGSGLARAVWIAAGVTALKWRKVGDTCPFCSKLDGTIVGVLENFIDADTGLEAEGKVLTSSGNVGHPPAHGGCDCTIVPVL